MASSMGLNSASAIKVFQFNPMVVVFTPQVAKTIVMNARATPFTPRPRLNPHAPAFTPADGTDEGLTNFTHKASMLNPLAAVWKPYGTTDLMITSIDIGECDPETLVTGSRVTFTDTADRCYHEEAGEDVGPDADDGTTEEVDNTAEEIEEEANEEADDTPLPKGIYFQYGMAMFDAVYKIRAEAGQAAIDDEEWGVFTHSYDLDQAIAADEERSKLDRRQLFHEDNLHHFNFLEQAVKLKSFTPPAVSLTIIMTRPKADFFKHGLQFHRSCLLQRAFLWIDPVIYTGPASILHSKQGSALQGSVTGFTHKYYTRHGWWRNNGYEEDEDRPFTDTTDPRQYDAEDTVLNGWYDNNWVPTRKSVWDAGEDIKKEAEAAFRKKSKKTTEARRRRPKSRLCANVHASDVEYNTVVSFRDMSTTETCFTKSPMSSNFIIGLDALDKELGWSKDWSDDIDDVDDPQHQPTPTKSASENCLAGIMPMTANNINSPMVQESVNPTVITQTASSSTQAGAQAAASSSETGVSKPCPEPTLPTTPVKSATKRSPSSLDVAPIKSALSNTRPSKALSKKPPISSVYADPFVDLKDAPLPLQAPMPRKTRPTRNGFPRTQSGFLRRTRSGTLKVGGPPTPEERNEMEINKIRGDIEDMMQTISGKAPLLCPITEDKQQCDFDASDDERENYIKPTKDNVNTEGSGIGPKLSNGTSNHNPFKQMSRAQTGEVNDGHSANEEFFKDSRPSQQAEPVVTSSLAEESLVSLRVPSLRTALQKCKESFEEAPENGTNLSQLHANPLPFDVKAHMSSESVGKRVTFLPFHTLHKFERYPSEVTPEKTAQSSTAADLDIESETGLEIIRRASERKLEGDLFHQSGAEAVEDEDEDNDIAEEPSVVNLQVTPNTKLAGTIKWESKAPHLFRWSNTKPEPPLNANGVFKPCLKQHGRQLSLSPPVPPPANDIDATEQVDEGPTTPLVNVSLPLPYSKASRATKAYGELAQTTPGKRPSCVPRMRSDESLANAAARNGNEYDREALECLQTALEPQYEIQRPFLDSIEEAAEFNPQLSLAEVVDASAIIEPLVLPTFRSIGRRPGPPSRLSKLFDKVTGHKPVDNHNSETSTGATDAPKQSKGQKLMNKITRRKPASEFPSPPESMGRKVKKAVVGSLRKTFGRKINVLN